MLNQIWINLLVVGTTGFTLGYWVNDLAKPVRLTLPEEQLQKLDTLITKLSNKKGGRPKKMRIGLHNR